MGSSLTIVNDTPFAWRCEFGADLQAMKIAVITAAGVASFGTAFGIWGAYALDLLGLTTVPVSGLVLGRVTVGTLKKVTKALETYGFLLASAGSMTAFFTNLIRTVHEEYVKRGYDTIEVKGFKRYGKMHPFSRREALCVRVYRLNATAVRFEHLVMRPIYSGGFQNNVNYSITHWIQKRGVRNEDLVAHIPIQDATTTRY